MLAYLKGFFTRLRASYLRKKLRNMEEQADISSNLWPIHVRRQAMRNLYEPTEQTLPVTHEALQKYAYYLAESDGFELSPEEYWYTAERLISRLGLTPHLATRIGYGH